MDGFLGQNDPLKSFSVKYPALERLENIAREIPKLLLTGSLQRTIKNLKPGNLSVDHVLDDNLNLNLAMNYLSFLSHAYVGRSRAK
jgi:hypothetical protein